MMFIAWRLFERNAIWLYWSMLAVLVKLEVILAVTPRDCLVCRSLE